MTEPISFLETAAGHIICIRCRAKSKRTGNQCGRPAMAGKWVCGLHGGLSTGPRTPDGRARCAAARTKHGRETRAIRSQRSRDCGYLKSSAARSDLSRDRGRGAGCRDLDIISGSANDWASATA
jgi:hypothetical protein